MKSKILKTALTFLLSIGLFNSCKNKNETNTIRIGVILPLTGKFAVIGDGEKKGVEMALDSLKTKYKDTDIEIIYEDFASETKNAVTVANKLISIDKVDAIITSTTAAAEAVSPIVEKAKIINFVISPDIDIVHKSKYNFRIYYNFNTEFEAVKNFVNINKPNSVSFLASRYSSLQKLVDDKLEPKFKESGISVLDKEYVEVTDKDFKNSIIKIKSKNPEILFLAPMTNQVDLYTNQLKDYGILPSNKTKLIGSFTFNWKSFDFISTLEGYYIVTPVFQTYNEDNIFIQKFFKKHKSKPSFDIAYAYDNIFILTDLLINSKKDFNVFKESFNKMGTLQGASGKINFVGSNETNAEIVITKIVKGKQQIQ